MRGRKPQMNWQKSKGQYTTTIDGEFYRLGTDEEGAEERFKFLLRKHDLGEPGDGNPTFGEVADRWLLHVEENHDPERYRLCFDRLEEFVGKGLKVSDLRSRHVEQWLAGKPTAPSPARCATTRPMTRSPRRVLLRADAKPGRLLPAERSGIDREQSPRLSSSDVRRSQDAVFLLASQPRRLP